MSATGVDFLIKKADLQSKCYVMAGSKAAFGFLTIPLRLYFKGLDVHGGGSLGPFIGWTFFLSRSLWLTPAFYAGAGLLADEDGKELFVASGAVALVGTLGGSKAQVGLAVGLDMNPDWKYHMSPWIMVCTGFNLFQIPSEKQTPPG